MAETSFLYAVPTILFFFCHCLIASCMEIPSIKTDESALVALKSSISYDPKNVISRNWSNSAPVCSWIGITCGSRHQRVTKLNVSYMNLEGRIPPELGNLSFLVSLSMRNNSFDGTLPQELANLRRLRSINLGNNNLSGPVPSFLSSLPNLQSLFLWGNQFSGPIPISIGNVSKLQNLVLARNFLEGTVPPEIGNLSYLTLLNLEDNRLMGPVPLPIFNLSGLHEIALTGNNLSGKLPKSICDNLPLLQGLYLSYNRFDGTIPSSLWKCQQLQELSLSLNEFVGSIPREIGNLSSLRALHLGYNNLQGQIPKEIGNIQKLKILTLTSCGLSGSIPESIFNISALMALDLGGDNLSGNLPPNFGQGMPNLQRLFLGRNSLSGFIPNSISNASKLTKLDLAHNNFVGQIPSSLGNLEFLQILNLANNTFVSPSSTSELSIFTSLANCRHLNKLELGQNPLGGNLPASIGNLSISLEIFSAYRCGIKGKVPQEIGNLSSLTLLNLAENELIGTIPTTVIKLQKLQRLYLDNNKITGFISNEICSLQELGALNLDQNLIIGALPQCLRNMTSLRYLYLASNMLNSTLPTSILKLSDMLELNASSNMLTGNLPLEIGNFKAMTLIDLSMNNLSGNIPTTIGDLQSIIYLSLTHNRLEGPIPDSIGRVLSLEHLDMSYNNLTGEIPKSLEALSYLTYFNVSFNDLSGEIPYGGPFLNFTKMSFISNKALCGASRFQVLPCQFTSSNKQTRKRALHIALYITLGFGAITIALVGLMFLRYRKRTKDEQDQTPILPPGLSHERISFDELQEATDGFSESNILGTGAFGSVYKGTLRDGTQVAVKVFNIQSEGAFKSFNTECEILRGLRHRNLTKVISSCSNLDFRALVLEYMPCGSLEKWLYSHNYFLDILERLNIAIDVACALDYLHNGYLMPVIHCDLKPSNVLLDNELIGHVSDFSISKVLGVGEDIARTKTLATIGYIAPEYGLKGLVSTKSDIYSYGILLMETITRTKPNDDVFVGELGLKQWIKDSLQSDITRVIDSNLLKQKEGNFDSKVQCLLSIIEVALKCTEEVPELRISITDAILAMNKIKLQFLTRCGESLE